MGGQEEEEEGEGEKKGEVAATDTTTSKGRSRSRSHKMQQSGTDFTLAYYTCLIGGAVAWWHLRWILTDCGPAEGRGGQALIAF